MKLINLPEADEILDHLESQNLLHGDSRVLGEIIRKRRFGGTCREGAWRSPVFRNCVEEVDGNYEGFVWSFDRIMSYLRISFMPQLAEVGL